MTDQIRVPKKIGHAEGGGNLPKLDDILGNLADGLKEIYDEIDDLNPAKRPLINSSDEYINVKETTPEDGAEDVTKGDNIEVTFDREVQFAVSEGETESAVKIYDDDDESEHTVDDVNIVEVSDEDVKLQIVPDGDLSSNSNHTVTIPTDAVVGKEDKLGLKEDYKFSFKTGD